MGVRGHAGGRIGTAREQSPVSAECITEYDALFGDFERAKVLAVRAPAHLHHAYEPLQLTVQLDIALHDDGIGQKGRAVRAEAQVHIAVLNLRGHHEGDAHSGEHRHHAIERLAKVLAKGGRQRQLKSRERVDD